MRSKRLNLALSRHDQARLPFPISEGNVDIVGTRTKTGTYAGNTDRAHRPHDRWINGLDDGWSDRLGRRGVGYFGRVDVTRFDPLERMKVKKRQGEDRKPVCCRWSE